MFGEHFYVDERPLNLLNKPAVYIFSRPFNLRSVKPRDTRRIYTTALLKQSMLCSENIRNTIEVINDDDLPYNIELSNGEIVCVRTFSWDSKSLNVILLFEYHNRYTLYAGRFISTGKILEHKFLTNLMQAKMINELFIDTTAYNITEFNLKRTACMKIEKIVKNRDCQFHMLIDSFGYEDLIFELSKKGVKIFLDTQSMQIFKLQQNLDQFCTNQTEADIILVNKLAEDTETQFREHKIISIKLTTHNCVEASDHLRIVKYTVYPTQADIFQIAFLAAPQFIYPINNSDSIPLELRELCR